MDITGSIIAIILCGVVYPLRHQIKNPKIKDDIDAILGIILVVIVVLVFFSVRLFSRSSLH